MRKVTFIIASLVLLFAVTSAYNDGNRGVQPGQTAPLSELPEAHTQSLSRAIATADGIAHSHRIHGSLAEKIRREFRLPDNCGGALLIASDGTVSAANPEF